MYPDEVANVVKLILNCKYDKALSEAEKALSRATKELGGNHPDLVVYLDLLTGSYEYNCLYEKISRLCDFKDNQSAILSMVSARK